MAQAQQAPPVALLDVPYISQTEALCGGAAAAMVLRYWGARGLDAESFAHLVDRSAAGIRTDALTRDIARRGWGVSPVRGDERLARDELARGRPVLALIEDRPGAFHYVVVVAWHERGVVFHDPARAPFRVMPTDEFGRRWRAAAEWMLIVVPGGPGGEAPGRGSPRDDATRATGNACGSLVEEGVRAAQANDLATAERALSAALTCPGAAAARELAGVRLLQRRWPEVATLADAAVAADPADAYAWKLLGTSRFVQDDGAGALAAWNRAGEPTVDLVRLDGLDRTRHRVVERLIGVERGGLLTPGSFTRARRRLRELPSASSTRLDYVPAPGGLVEIRGAVAERRVVPSTPLAYAAIGLTAAATRELRVVSSSATGGGERMFAAWRFWPHRPLIAAGVEAPAPWGGLWGADVDAERQPFSDPALAPAERRRARVTIADWATGTVRWSVEGGLEHREREGRLGFAGGGLTFASAGDRLQLTMATSRWLGDHGFGTGSLSLIARSRADRQGMVLLAAAAVHAASSRTPMDLWPAGDTGHARGMLLRAHPVLADGRLRAERLGRVLASGSVEAQRWWTLRGAIGVAGAVFADAARAGRRLDRPPRDDLDAGLGARLAMVGIPGIFRIDAAKGLRDGATALSFAYELQTR